MGLTGHNYLYNSKEEAFFKEMRVIESKHVVNIKSLSISLFSEEFRGNALGNLLSNQAEKLVSDVLMLYLEIDTDFENAGKEETE